jgi:hypothetical protein
MNAKSALCCIPTGRRLIGEGAFRRMAAGIGLRTIAGASAAFIARSLCPWNSGRTACPAPLRRVNTEIPLCRNMTKLPSLQIIRFSRRLREKVESPTRTEP